MSLVFEIVTILIAVAVGEMCGVILNDAVTGQYLHIVGAFVGGGIGIAIANKFAVR